MKIALFYNPQSFDAPPQGTLANVPNQGLMYLIFLETRIIHLHFPADSLCRSSFNQFLPRDATLYQSAIMKLHVVCPSVRCNTSEINSRPNSLRRLLWLTPTWAIGTTLYKIHCFVNGQTTTSAFQKVSVATVLR